MGYINHSENRFVARFTVPPFFSFLYQSLGLWAHRYILTYFNHHIYIYKPPALKRAKEAAVNKYSLQAGKEGIKDIQWLHPSLKAQ